MGTPYGCTASTTMEDLICVLPSPNVDFSVSTSQVSFGSSEVDFTNNSTNAVDYIWDYGDGTTDSLVFYPGPHEFDIDDEEFLMPYGDGVGDVNISELIDFHKNHKKLVTLTATIPEGRFGAINIKGDQVVDIKEKLDTADKFINGGFFVINKMALQYVNNLSEQWEMEPLSKIASDGQLMAFKHRGFWKAMDHLRDKIQLDGLANQKNPPWKTWK